MPDNSLYIWIVEAATVYRRSRSWLESEVEAGRLTYAKFSGDRRIYLRRDELDRIVGKPIIEERRQDGTA